MMTVIEINRKISETYFTTLKNLEEIIKTNNGKKPFSKEIQERIKWYNETKHTCYKCLQPIKNNEDFFIIVENISSYIMDYRLHSLCERPLKGWC